MQQLLFDDLAELVLPADVLIDPANNDIEVPQDPRFQIAGRMDTFLSRAGQVRGILLLRWSPLAADPGSVLY